MPENTKLQLKINTEILLDFDQEKHPDLGKQILELIQNYKCAKDHQISLSYNFVSEKRFNKLLEKMKNKRQVK